MPRVHVSREDFLRDRQGREFSDILKDPTLPFDALLEFFNRRELQRRMEDSEISSKQAPLAAVVRDLEAVPSVQAFMASSDAAVRKRFEQAITIVVRLVMERLGWQVIPRK
ncbi:MAG: hypothetical protein ACYC6Y_11395 [Thermoguttaceae bacterium]